MECRSSTESGLGGGPWHIAHRSSRKKVDGVALRARPPAGSLTHVRDDRLLVVADGAGCWVLADAEPRGNQTKASFARIEF
jgi:hypothetical protein